MSDNEEESNESKLNGTEDVLDAKRKRDSDVSSDCENDAEFEVKKSKNSEKTAPSSPTFITLPDQVQNSNPIMYVAPEKVGQIIGSKGMIIQEMQARTGCKITVNQDFPPGVNREVAFAGTVEQIKAARQLVELVLEQGPTVIHMLNGPVITNELDCPHPLVGRIIGSGGATIREVQTKCGARIQINQDFPDGVPRKITITGNPNAVQIATQMIQHIMENGPPNQGNPANSGGGGAVTSVTPNNFAAVGGVGMTLSGGVGSLAVAPGSTPTNTVLECPKGFVGRLIGRGGETINLIQSKSGARVQIDQTIPEGHPCRVNISGSQQNVVLAAQFVQEIIVNGPNKVNGMPNFSAQSATLGSYGPPPVVGVGYYGPPAGAVMAPAYSIPPYSQPQPYMQPQYVQPQMNGLYPGVQPMYGVQYNGVPQHQPQIIPQQQPYVQQTPVQWQQQPQHQQQHHHQQQTQQHAQHQQHHVVIQPVSQSSKLPPGWSEHKTDDGHLYWYNSSTGVSQWERPI